MKVKTLGLSLKRAVRIIVGGTWGLLAWSMSGASVIAVVIWGLKAVAIPLLMLKTASWGIWGLGVIRESRMRNAGKDAQDKMSRK